MLSMQPKTKEYATEMLSFHNRSSEMQNFYKNREFEVGNSYAENNPFLDDIQTIRNSYIFRRLQGIYQFDIGNEGYQYQNRLTHSVIVESVAEQICHKLKLDSSSAYIARAISLIHDIGHPPYGHRGERAIREFLKKHQIPYEYNHDLMGLLLVSRYAKSSHKYPGLNLSMAVIEGLLKRYWRYRSDLPESHFNHSLSEIPSEIMKLNKRLGAQYGVDLQLDKFNHIEGQISAISDWIAFTATDIEDGLRNGMIKPDELIQYFPVVKEICKKIKWEDIKVSSENHVSSKNDAAITLLMKSIQNYLIEDVVSQTRVNIIKEMQKGGLKTGDDVGKLSELLVTFTPDTLQHLNEFGNYCNKSVFPRLGRTYAPTGLTLSDKPFEQLCLNYLEDLYSRKASELKLDPNFHWEAGLNWSDPMQRALLCVQIFSLNVDKNILLWHKQKCNTTRNNYELFTRVPSEFKSSEENVNKIRSKL